MSTNYPTFVSQIANMMAALSSDPNFVTFLPGAIDYAEQRIYRELDLQYTLVTDDTTRATSGVNIFATPVDVGTYITVDQVNIITPAGTQSSNGGIRNPLVPATQEFIDFSYPTQLSSQTGLPEYYALTGGLSSPSFTTNILLGPAPDQAYFVEIRGVQRPTPLSSGNSSTILTQYVPDLFFAAAMIFAAGYMRDFGAQADNPQMAQSWETQYKNLVQSAAVEQFRLKHLSEAFTAKQPNQLARRA